MLHTVRQGLWSYMYMYEWKDASIAFMLVLCTGAWLYGSVCFHSNSKHCCLTVYAILPAHRCLHKMASGIMYDTVYGDDRT